MEIKIDTEALSNNNSNKAANNQIIEEMMNFHINEIDQFLLKQDSKYLISEYFIIKILSFVIENTEEKSLTLLAEIKASHQTLYDFKVNDQVFIFSKSNDFYNRLMSHCQKNSKKDPNLSGRKMNFNLNNFNTKFDFVKSESNLNGDLLNSQTFPRKNSAIYEIRIDLDECIFIPGARILSCINMSFNIDDLNTENSNYNKNLLKGNKIEIQDRIFLIMIILSSIIKIYFFYYKKFKFNKWDSFLINSPYFEEAILLSLILNFMGLKSAINKTAIRNNFDNFALSDLNELTFELENLDLIFNEQGTQSENMLANLKENLNENNFFTNENNNSSISANMNDLSYFYSNYLKNSQNNKIEIINLNDQEGKIENFQKEEYLNFDFETQFFNYVFDTTGEGLNNKNKISFFKLLQNEGNIIINDNMNEKIQIDPRDIMLLYNKSISVCFINIVKNLKFNINHGKLTNFVLDFLSKLIFLTYKNVKKILKKINLSVTFCNIDNEFNLNADEYTNKQKFYNLYVFDL